MDTEEQEQPPHFSLWNLPKHIQEEECRQNVRGMFAFNNLIHTLVLPPQLISYLFDCVFPRPPFFTHFISLSRFPLYGFHLIKQRLRSKFLPLEWNTEYGISLEARESLNQVLLLLSFSFDLFRVFACKATGRRTRDHWQSATFYVGIGLAAI